MKQDCETTKGNFMDATTSTYLHRTRFTIYANKINKTTTPDNHSARALPDALARKPNLI
jgi:hypothetical protein